VLPQPPFPEVAGWWVLPLPGMLRYRPKALAAKMAVVTG
jgi:hypothetical protein